MSPQLTYALSKLDSSQVAVAGGKGSSLGELMQAAVPVPPGCVVASAAFEAFISGGDHQRYVDEVVRMTTSYTDRRPGPAYTRAVPELC
ncbi:MAG: PEP/pyruvate-binding domain-containing protein [Pseudomonadota bacterium]